MKIPHNQVWTSNSGFKQENIANTKHLKNLAARWNEARILCCQFGDLWRCRTFSFVACLIAHSTFNYSVNCFCLNWKRSQKNGFNSLLVMTFNRPFVFFLVRQASANLKLVKWVRVGNSILKDYGLWRRERKRRPKATSSINLLLANNMGLVYNYLYCHRIRNSSSISTLTR